MRRAFVRYHNTLKPVDDIAPDAILKVKHGCGACDGTVAAAHISWGQEGGVGLKSPDNLCVPLCMRCHADQEAHPGPEWWAGMVKNIAQQRYLKYCGCKGFKG